MNRPQCATCPVATYHRALPATRTDPPEPAYFECGITDEFIEECEAPEPGTCDYLTGWQAHQPHPLDAALEHNNEAGNTRAAMWLVENVPADILRRALSLK